MADVRWKKALLALSGLAVVFSSVMPLSANAWPFGRRDRPADAAQPTAQQTTARPATPAGRGTPAPRPGMTPSIQMPGEASSAASATTPAMPQPATPEQRRAARSLDAIRQADFWMSQLQINPQDREAAVEASTLLRRLGSADRAVEMAAIGLQAHEADPQLWAALGQALVANGRGQEAVQALQRAISLNRNDIALHSALGVAWDLLERPDMAEPAYRAALALNPNDPKVLTNYGLSLALAGRMLEGEQMLRQASNNPEAPPQARQNLALVVGLQGRFAESEALATQDLPPQVAAENVAYLRQMLNGEGPAAGGGGSGRWEGMTSSAREPNAAPSLRAGQ
jgi:Flp pilus assembly protein TadD